MSFSVTSDKVKHSPQFDVVNYFHYTKNMNTRQEIVYTSLRWAWHNDHNLFLSLNITVKYQTIVSPVVYIPGLKNNMCSPH